MLLFLKKIFGAKPSESTPAPYKVEQPSQFPFPKPDLEADCVKKTVAKKPVAKKSATKKPTKKSKEQ